MADARSILDTLSKDVKAELLQRLHKSQNEVCYVCQNIINLSVHRTDIDHILALSHNGVDAEQNWGLTHESCNRSKGARDLQLQRTLYRFKSHVESYANSGTDGSIRNFTVNEALNELYPKRQDVGAVIQNGEIQLSYNWKGNACTDRFLLLEDPETPGFTSFVGMIPFECIHHDAAINPRSIVDLEAMIEEFYNRNPQLQPSLATLSFESTSGKGKILLFDGQHKAAAQMYLGRARLYVRTFINCDKSRLKETNFRAHTRLAQIHFPQLVEDRVGDDLFLEEFTRYLDTGDFAKKSERAFFREHLPSPQRAEFRKYFTSYLRYEVLTGKAGTKPNEILNYVETITARSKRYPLSYDAVQKTFLDHFLWLKPSREPLEVSQNMRTLERENLIRLMNLFVEEILASNRFDFGKGIYRIEEQLTEAPDSIPDSHLRAYRLCRSAAMIIWSLELMRAIALLLNTLSKYQASEWPKERPLWAVIEQSDWERIRKMIRVVRDHKIWGERTNPNIVSAISSTRQRDWKEILLQGQLPQRQEQLLPKLDQNYIFQNSQ